MIIRFHSEARKEFFRAVEFYEEQVVGLGYEFIDEVEKVLEVIEANPNSGTKITNSERRFLVSRFPYGVIYTAIPNQIFIFAVMDLRRKPGYWTSRK
ncbi:MAG: type II toxin-antitoxin system RelE/ParE family toxin [Balneolaceae bacterium]